MTLKNVIQIWKAKGQILEGVKNNLFKKEDVEEIAQTRLKICYACETFDLEGKGCMVPGTQPCCNQDKGGCGCSLSLKTRSLSSSCPLDKWPAEVTEQEEDLIKQKLGL